MSRASHLEPCTICTAIAADPVRTVRTYATIADYEPRLVVMSREVVPSGIGESG